MKTTLEIILITYNRKSHLRETLNWLFAENSPVKDLDITILNNKSTDGTTELIEEYKKRYPHIKHIIHTRNIGGNANIARAFELASKKYVWILCDDDAYNWDSWGEIEEALSKDYDLIFTRKELIRKNDDIAQLLHQATFVPGCIYNTKCIDSNVMMNIYNTGIMMFSQIMASYDTILYHRDKIFIPQNDIVIRGNQAEESDKTLVRGLNENNIHPDYERIFWHIGFMKAAQIIKDKKMKEYVLKNVNFNEQWNQSFWDYISTIFIYNQNAKNDNIKNIVDLCLCFDGVLRLQLIIYSLLYLTLFRIFYIYRDNKGYMIRIFNKIKTRLIKIG